MKDDMLRPTLLDESKEKTLYSYYATVNKKGEVITVASSNERKKVSYKDLRKAYFSVR